MQVNIWKEDRIDLRGVWRWRDRGRRFIELECLNLALLYKLPVVFLCENNGYAVHSRIEARQGYALAEHAKGYGMPVTVVKNGMDFDAVHKAISAAVSATRGGKGPHMVVVDTYRYKEHVGPGDDLPCRLSRKERAANLGRA